MVIDFYNRNGGSPSPTGDATELQPKTAIPESGAAGTVIALNKPDEEGWTSFITGSGKSRTQISYYVEPSENPNPDLSQRPTRYEFDVRYADTVDENGNYTYSNSTSVELTVDYQGNITFTNLGNFSQDGDGYSLTSDINNTSTGEHIQKTLYMSLENGYLYFNNGQGDCPYDTNLTQFEYYWQDMGSWDESDPENPVWQESWTEMNTGVAFQSWGIASPAKIGIYQANSANTYVEFVAKNADEAGFTRKLKMYQGNIHSDHFKAGDMIVPNEGNYLPLVKTSEGDGFDSDFIRLADGNDVAVLQQRINNLQIDEVYAKEDTPIYVNNGNLIAVHNSGETVVKQAYAESGFTYVPMSWGDVERVYGVRQAVANGFGYIVAIGENRMMLNLWYNADDASNPYWGYDQLRNDGWNVTETDSLTFTAEDPNGWGYTLSGYSDGTYVYCEWNVPAVEFYGGGAESKRVPQSVYQTAVMSKQGVCQIWKGTQQEYDAITTKDSSTIYVII